MAFGYSVGDRVLHGVSFSVGGGCTVALVGATGSGKARLGMCLLCCNPDAFLVLQFCSPSKAGVLSSPKASGAL